MYRDSPGKFDSRTLSRETLSRWTGRTATVTVTATVTSTVTIITISISISISITITITTTGLARRDVQGQPRDAGQPAQPAGRQQPFSACN